MSVSVHQAAANAFATWLASKLTGVTVEPRWPSPDKKLPAKAITIVTAGRRIDTPLDLKLLSSTNSGATQTNAVWQLAACRQPFQLDIWAQSDIARDDLIAQLDSLLHADSSSLTGAFNPMPVGHGLLLKLGDGWDAVGTIADFDFEEPDLDDTPATANRHLYRATYRGNAYFMLTVTTLTARQTAISFLQRISETDPTTDSGTTYTTPPF